MKLPPIFLLLTPHCFNPKMVVIKFISFVEKIVSIVI